MHLGDLEARWTRRLLDLDDAPRPRAGATRRQPVLRRPAAYVHDDDDADAVVQCLPGFRGPGRVGAVPPTTLGEHLAAQLAGSRGLRLTTSSVDGQRLRR